MKKNAVLIILLLSITTSVLGIEIDKLRIENFSLKYDSSQGEILFKNFNLRNNDLELTNSNDQVIFLRQEDHLKANIGNSSILINNFYKDFLSEISQLYIDNGYLIFKPGKQFSLKFDSATINSNMYPKLLISCEDNTESNNDFYYFFKPCLTNGWLQIPKYEIKIIGKKSLMPTKWRNITVQIDNNNFFIRAESVKRLGATLKIKGILDYDPLLFKLSINFKKAKFGFLSIKKTIKKMILNNMPNATLEDDTIVISL